MNNFFKLILGILRVSIERNLYRIRSRATQQRLNKLIQSLPQAEENKAVIGLRRSYLRRSKQSANYLQKQLQLLEEPEDHQVTMATIQERWDLGNDDFVAAILAQFNPQSTTCVFKQPPTKKGKSKSHAQDSVKPKVESSKVKRTPKAKSTPKTKGGSKRKPSGQGVSTSTETSSG
jgi:hypothetical protein